MKICHVCFFECDDNTELCPVCGADLERKTEEADNTKEPQEALLKEPVLLATIEDVVSEEIFKDILKDNGIPYACDNATGEGTMQVLFGGGFISDNIYVDRCDFDKADALYSEFLESQENAFEEDSEFDADGE